MISHIKQQKSVYRGILFLALYCFSCFLSCAAVPNATVPRESPPEWVVNLDAVYPQTQYIAQKGWGANRETAELSALGAISRFFESEVTSRQDLVSQYSEINGAVSDLQQVNEAIFVNSQTKLFAVRYSDAWYNTAQKQWECAAYINRGEAWTIYEPVVRGAVQEFNGFFTAAENSGEPLRAMSLYIRAGQLSNEITQVLAFAQILNPKEASNYGNVRAAISDLPQKTGAAKSRSSFYIECPKDFESAASTAAARALSEMGFSVQKNRSGAAYICLVDIDEGEQKAEAGTFYYPAVKISITGKTGALFSYSASVPRQGAVTPNVAKRRAYSALAKEIQSSFLDKLQKNF